MTLFIVLCIVMAAVAIGFIVRPLLRTDVPAEMAGSGKNQPGKVAAIATAVALPLLAAALYVNVSNWQWDYDPSTAASEQNSPDVEAMVARLESRLASEPQDVEGWLMLGRSFVMLGRYPRAVEAFEKAYDLTDGGNLQAITGLAEALVLVDETSLGGRAGELLDSALKIAPREPRALWYGSLAALAAGDLALARDRMQLLLDQNPPEQVRNLLETQIAEISAELGTQPSAAAQSGAAAPAAQPAAVDVAVSVAPTIAARIDRPLTLFVLARDAAGGPPLAVVRLSSGELPRTVELSDAGAMIAGRGLSSAARVQIVARLSQSGNAQAQSGDFYGEAEYVVQPGRGSVNIVIDREAP